MTPHLAPISSAILSLAWQGQAGITYTIQVTSDLHDWATLPYVVEGSGDPESYFLDRSGLSQFARLQYDNEGDTNDNALPDMWEWQQFGQIGIDPDADPDLDGWSNLQEWDNQTDPNDFYNSEWPEIHIACGTDWLVPAGNVSSQNLSLYLHKPTGEPWSHAPVTLTMASGEPALVLVGENGQLLARELHLLTDANGRIHAVPELIHVLAADNGGTVDEIIIRAGNSDAGIQVYSIGDSFGLPPRGLSLWTNAEGQQVYSWKGDPGTAQSILIERKNASGNWEHVVETATNELLPPDPETGYYTLILNN